MTHTLLAGTDTPAALWTRPDDACGQPGRPMVGTAARAAGPCRGRGARGPGLRDRGASSGAARPGGIAWLGAPGRRVRAVRGAVPGAAGCPVSAQASGPATSLPFSVRTGTSSSGSVAGAWSTSPVRASNSLPWQEQTRVVPFSLLMGHLPCVQMVL